MPLGTLDRTAPPLFNQGPSALSKLVFFSALALLLMVADARFHLVKPLRQALGAAIYPLQWVALKPVQLASEASRYFEELAHAQSREDQARRALAAQAERAALADRLAAENARLRSMLELRQTAPAPGRVGEVLYEAPDPYTRKVVIDQGQAQGIAAGSPVIDEQGVLGQVTQVQPFTSEITLVTDRDLSIPVQNMRTGMRSLAYGDASARGLELRFMAASADVQEGDVLTTSGVDGVYPAGLPVARVDRIERRADSAFARIYCLPAARVEAARYVLVLQPVARAAPGGPADAAAVPPRKADDRAGGGRSGADSIARDARPAAGRAAAASAPAEPASTPRRGATGSKPAASAAAAKPAPPPKPAAPSPSARPARENRERREEGRP